MCLDFRLHVDWHPTASEGLHAQRRPAVGQPGHQAWPYVEWLKGMSLNIGPWQNVVHWRREWQTTPVFLPWEPHEQCENAKRYDTERQVPPRLVGVQYVIGEEQRDSLRKNEETEPKWKWCPVLDVSADGSKVQCCKEEYCIGIWNVRSMNQGKLEFTLTF